jgi:hypothetical protein
MAVYDPNNEFYPAGIGWNAGELVLFCGRLATILSVDRVGRPLVIEFTDDGGRTRKFAQFSINDLRPVSTDENDVLDSIVATTQPPLTLQERRARKAEVWLAEPQVGDCFNQGTRLYLTIEEIRADGSLVCSYLFPRGETVWLTRKSWIFDNAETLRCRFEKKTQPGYLLIACSSTRLYSDLEGAKNIPVPGGESPL